ncbi:MAG TPA: hypothetical protein VE133_08195 [Candidatus Sulfotelmatobacter sp.]|jgi:hypothetical protein|nr:hypothetical protein [Candidatus Sulfotelmatobacter sp.]
MARKKTARKKKAVVRRKPAAKKKVATKKKAARKQAAARKKGTKKKSATKKTSPGRREISSPVSLRGRRGLGGAAGGQSGDTQGLSRRAYDDSESIEELLEEGQSMEAEAVSGVENAPDADQGEVRTRQFPEDDVPEEYLDQD